MALDKKQLLQWVATGKTQKAIDEILAHQSEVREDLYAQVVVLASDLAENRSAKLLDTLSEGVLRVQRNKINQSLVLIIEQLDKPAPTLSDTVIEQTDTTSTATTSDLESTRSQVEKLVDTIAYVITQLIKRPLKYKFINGVVLLLVFLNPLILGNGLKVAGFPAEWMITYHYCRFFWIITGALFVGAVMVAVRDILKSGSTGTAIQYAANSPIKGLRSFDFEDAGIFRKLQRNEDINTCTQGLGEKEFRFGVLTGESGCGKTSFLRAGLYPALIKDNCACVVVKLRNEPPLLSIREALKEQLDGEITPGVDLSSLKQLLEYYLHRGQKEELVLIIDQFEQFFTQQKTMESRKPFINELLDCYQNLPEAKIMVSLRKDFQGYLYEIQDVLGYGLFARRNYFDLRKFAPIQATEIFKIMAEAEGLEFDSSFVYDMCKEELASKDDGLISAVDIQILAFIIKGQQLEEKAFTRSAFQKMGGVEGLLQRFLEEQFETPNRYNQDQAALKVLLAFIDLENNVRSGDLTVQKLRPRIDNTVNPSDVEPILDWLEELRLISKTEAKDRAVRYELAHERLIIPLRNLAGKTLTQMDQANIILERRTNEWLANEQKSRFLLTWSEYRNIIKHQKLVTWGKNEAAKRSLLQASKRKFQLRTGIVAALLLISLSGWIFNRQNTAVINLLNEAENHIVGLEYDSAAFKLWDAGKIGFKRRRVSQKLLEVVFYYNEIGASDRAANLLQDTVLKISGNNDILELLKIKGLAAKQAWKNIDQAIQTMDPAFYENSLLTRYFPVMDTVIGRSFLLGCPSNDCDTTANNSIVEVTLPNYRIARTETTVWQYELFAKATGRKQTKEEEWDWMGHSPAINVSWFDAIVYSNWLSERKEIKKTYDIERIPNEPNDLYRDTSILWSEIVDWDGLGYRLPTEAEWEYAARGGRQLDPFLFSGSDTVGVVAWYGDNAGLVYPFNRTHPVASLKANSLGLYDMSGNVFEWCWDWYSDGFDPQNWNHPKGPLNGRRRVLRGGSWVNYDINCEVSIRFNYFNNFFPDYRYFNIGFRLAQGL